jgi:hypothetical protein
MKQPGEIKEAIISVQDGTLNIIFGAINKVHENYHDNVSIQIENGGYEIHVKGRKLKSVELDDEIFEYEERFKSACEMLKGFEERIKITETKKFSWRTFKREVVDSVKSVYNYKKRYVYQEKYWNDREYKTNNWVFTEFKPEADDTRGKD